MFWVTIVLAVIVMIAHMFISSFSEDDEDKNG